MRYDNEPQCNFKSPTCEKLQPENPFFHLVPGLELAVISHFTTEAGARLNNVPISYRTLGRLAPDGCNAIVVCHPWIGEPDFPTWWAPLVQGEGCALDPSRFFIVCCTVLGSPYGSASPMTYKNSKVAEGRYGKTFPNTTIRDDINIHRIVIEALGVKQIAAVIGGSMGGMYALEWAYLGTDLVKRIVSISACARTSTASLGWSEVQRRSIYADPKFKDGDYSITDPPNNGLAAAYMSIMLRCRSQEYFESRFGLDRVLYSARNENDLGYKHQPKTHPTQKGLNAQGQHTQSSSATSTNIHETLPQTGELLARRFDANCWIAMRQKIDKHDISRGRVPESILGCHNRAIKALKMIKQTTLLIGVPSDMLYPFAEQCLLAQGIPNSRLEIIESIHGHETFFAEASKLNAVLVPFLTRVPDSGSGKARL